MTKFKKEAMEYNDLNKKIEARRLHPWWGPGEKVDQIKNKIRITSAIVFVSMIVFVPLILKAMEDAGTLSSFAASTIWMSGFFGSALIGMGCIPNNGLDHKTKEMEEKQKKIRSRIQEQRLTVKQNAAQKTSGTAHINTQPGRWAEILDKKKRRKEYLLEELKKSEMSIKRINTNFAKELDSQKAHSDGLRNQIHAYDSNFKGELITRNRTQQKGG